MKAEDTGKFINVHGLDDLLRFLKKSDPELRKAIRAGLKDAAQPILTRARANAMKIADDGTYADSLSISITQTGAVKLRSTDVAAPVKEFAKPGATYVPKPTDKRINARKMSTFPVGVPKRANKPRVMIPAIEDSTKEVVDRINARLEQVLRGADG